MTKAKRNLKLKAGDSDVFRQAILSWYDRHRRDLPWRAKAGKRAKAYHVWLSEIMLQQTTVTAVAPHYMKFLQKWPDVHALACAKAPDVMSAWAGLGYYARARNLHACAKIVSKDLKGIFPEEQEALKKLPGIGDYTSAAIRTIAFDKPATVMDGNIERVMARYFAVREPLPGAKPVLKSLAAGFFENYEERPGDLAQAMMDLGAAICIPGKPRCSLCPLNQTCEARGQNIQDKLPARAAKKARPKKAGHVYWVSDSKNRVLIEERPARGLLGGMPGFPTSSWDKAGKAIKPPIALQSFKMETAGRNAVVRHVFTHFELELTLKKARAAKGFKAPAGYKWVEAGALKNVGFPSLFKKAFKLYNREGIIK
ncbi:MAG: A/G-specific adenine glycosylase [Alphaproteobacteria bacterium]